MAAFNNPNLAILELVATALGPVCDSVIFVGGCATGLLLTQERPDRIRITEEVDIVAQALTIHDYHAIEVRVRAQGFSNDMRPKAPICRWVHKNVTLDLMPTVKEILGFANRWYPHALQTATLVTLPGGTTIKMISAPAFIGTKLEAFKTEVKMPMASQIFWAVMTWKISSVWLIGAPHCWLSAGQRRPNCVTTWPQSSRLCLPILSLNQACRGTCRATLLASSVSSHL